MKCAWHAFINLLPQRFRSDVDRLAMENLQELRLRVGSKPVLICKEGNNTLNTLTTKQDVEFVINVSSEFSPWSAGTIAQGFITAPGGHRVGVCGKCTVYNGNISGITQPSSLCLRVARDFDGIASKLSEISESVLIIGPPGSGKTTLLRDLIRSKSNYGQGSVSVVDEREELFPQFRGSPCFVSGERTDVLSGCSKADGVEMVLRTMNPTWIAVDEITAESDCYALLNAGWCGVNLMATAHAASINDLKCRPIYKIIMDHQLFSLIVVLRRDKSWTMERISECC